MSSLLPHILISLLFFCPFVACQTSCSQFTSCASCNGAQSQGILCGWCAAGSSVNGGTCLSYQFGSPGIPTGGACDTGFYNYACCDSYSTCTTCQNSVSNQLCGWCAAGSSINSGKCVPYAAGSPGVAKWQGCDANYYNYACCDSYTTCQTCQNSVSKQLCGWCANGSSVNGGKCVPYSFGSPGVAKLQGCDANYYNYACCDSYSTCTTCQNSVSKQLCGWCANGSSINQNTCLPYAFGSPSVAKWSGCSSGQYNAAICPVSTSTVSSQSTTQMNSQSTTQMNSQSTTQMNSQSTTQTSFSSSQSSTTTSTPSAASATLYKAFYFQLFSILLLSFI